MKLFDTPRRTSGSLFLALPNEMIREILYSIISDKNAITGPEYGTLLSLKKTCKQLNQFIIELFPLVIQLHTLQIKALRCFDDARIAHKAIKLSFPFFVTYSILIHLSATLARNFAPEMNEEQAKLLALKNLLDKVVIKNNKALSADERSLAFRLREQLDIDLRFISFSRWRELRQALMNPAIYLPELVASVDKDSVVAVRM